MNKEAHARAWAKEEEADEREIREGENRRISAFFLERQVAAAIELEKTSHKSRGHFGYSIPTMRRKVGRKCVYGIRCGIYAVIERRINLARGGEFAGPPADG